MPCMFFVLIQSTHSCCFYRYYHELFLRGRSDLARNITRTRIKGNGMKAASSPSTEPNFYAMEFCEDREDLPPIVQKSVDKTSFPKMERISLASVASNVNLISPPSSPGASPSLQIFLEPPDEDPLSSSLHSGDEAFFEGHKFRYLDHLDLEDYYDVFTDGAMVIGV